MKLYYECTYPCINFLHMFCYASTFKKSSNVLLREKPCGIIYRITGARDTIVQSECVNYKMLRSQLLCVQFLQYLCLKTSDALRPGTLEYHHVFTEGCVAGGRSQSAPGRRTPRCPTAAQARAWCRAIRNGEWTNGKRASLPGLAVRSRGDLKNWFGRAEV